MQADMQRTIVMMRPLGADGGTGTGFCRMERKGNRGKLVLNVQGLRREGPLHVALVSQDGNGQRVEPCGEMFLDARGHGSVTHNLDILTASAAANHRAVCVLERMGDGLTAVMAGFFGKGRPFDRCGIESMAAKALGIAPPAVIPRSASLSSAVPEAADPPPMAEPVSNPVFGLAAEPVMPSATILSAAGEEEICPNAPALLFDESWEGEASSGGLEMGNGAEESTVPDNVWARPGQAPGMAPAMGLPEELQDVVWPDAVMPLRELFERFDLVGPVTGAENEIFISIPMNGGMMEIDHYFLGVRIEGGEVVAIGYGIPGSADAPPTGLEGYAWFETPLGGYWLKWEEA